jgi:hypothetical protein
MNIWLKRTLVGAIGAWLLAGCGSESSGPTITNPHGDAVDSAEATGDLTSEGVFPVDGGLDQRPLDLVLEVGAEATADQTSTPEVVEPEVKEEVVVLGGFGDPCKATTDCESLMCLFGRCTVECSGDCPEWYECKGVSIGETTYACISETVTLCMPCITNEDCTHPMVETLGLACMSYGMEGAFCALPCAADADCPPQYSCDAWQDVEGNGFTGCRKKGGPCICTDYALDQTPSTVCLIGNELGSCPGSRGCAPDGSLTDCEGELPAVEACDGLDNDCDGDVDEKLKLGDCTVDSIFGSCPGKMVCLDGETQCDAPEPEKEKCDGKDNDCDGEIDEGFQDNNGNGILDCLETDTDEDGILDYDDNCPELANADQKDFDQDESGDVCDDDDDDDGSPDGEDCLTLDPTVHPGNAELCNGKDDNCNDKVDEGYLDSNFDGTADCVEPDTDKDAVFDYEDNCPLVPNPKQENSDGDSLGDACDGDLDGDGVEGEADCDPLDPTVHGGAEELCDGKDNDCDGKVDFQACNVCDPCSTWENCTAGYCYAAPQVQGSEKFCTSSPFKCVFKDPATSDCLTADVNAKVCVTASLPMLCGSNGLWWAMLECSGDTPACYKGDCKVCVPGFKKCNGNQIMSCKASGLGWEIWATCPDSQACSDGKCISK